MIAVKEFILLCLLFAVCVLCVCVLIIAFSHQISTKRGQVGTVPINLLIIDHPGPLPPTPLSTQHVNHRTLLVLISLIKLFPLHPKMLGIWLTPSLYPFRREKTNNPNIRTLRRTTRYWECCLIAFRRQNPEWVQPEHYPAHKLICDHENLF